jgi:hypothetical protein
MDARWDKHFDKNLHAAGFWFNPNNQYDPDLMAKYNFTTSGVLDVIEKYAGKDIALRSALTKEMKIFRNGEGDFGRATAKNDRHLMLAGKSAIVAHFTHAYFCFFTHFSSSKFYFFSHR